MSTQRFDQSYGSRLDLRLKTATPRATSCGTRKMKKIRWADLHYTKGPVQPSWATSQYHNQNTTGTLTLRTRAWKLSSEGKLWHQRGWGREVRSWEVTLTGRSGQTQRSN
eukprot:747664-Hanusia_phi.AAC.2